MANHKKYSWKEVFFSAILPIFVGMMLGYGIIDRFGYFLDYFFRAPAAQSGRCFYTETRPIYTSKFGVECWLVPMTLEQRKNVYVQLKKEFEVE